MHCFYHPDSTAAGVCHVCGRGVCLQCADSGGRFLACKERCTVEARRLADLRDFSLSQPALQTEQLRRSTFALRSSAGFSLTFGSLLLAMGLYEPQLGKIFLWLGPVMLVFGAIQLSRYWRAPRNTQFRICGRCGYNLTGNTTGICPECGWRG